MELNAIPEEVPVEEEYTSAETPVDRHPPVVDLGDDDVVEVPDWQFEEPDILSQLPENRVSEEALVNASVSVGPDADTEELIAAYGKIKSDLVLTGRSEDAEAIKTVLESDNEEIRKKLTLEALQDPTIPREQKASLLNYYLDERGPQLTALQEYHDSLLYGKEYFDERRKLLADNAINNALAADEWRQAEQAEINNAAAREDTSLGMAAFDFLRMLTPGGAGYTAAEVSKELTGEVSWLDRVAQQLFAGSTIKGIREHLSTLEGEERLAAVKAVNRVLEEVPLGGMHSMYMREDIVTGTYETWQLYLDNIVGVLDILGIGWAVKGLAGRAAVRIAKTLGKSPEVPKGTLTTPPGSPAGIAAVTDPDKAAEMHAANIMGPPSPMLSEVEKAIGATRTESIVDTVLPKVTVGEGSKVPDVIVTALTAAKAQVTRLLDNAKDNSAYYITTADKALSRNAFYSGVRTALDDAAGAVLHVNKSVVETATYFGFKGMGVYGQTAKLGYETPLEAIEAAYKTSADPRDIVVLAKNMKTKRLEVYDGPNMAKFDDVANGRNVPVRKSMATAAALNKTIEKLQTDEVRALFNNATEVTPEIAKAREEVLTAASKTLGDSLGNVKDTFKERWLRRVISGEAQLDKLAIKGVADVKFNKEIGKFETRSGAYSDEFFFGHKYNHTFDPTDAATFGMDAVSRLRQFKYGGFLLDVVSGFNNQISSMFLHATNQANNIERKLLKDIISKHITPLSNAGKKRVFEALEEGSQQQKTWDYTKLVTKYEMNEKEIIGYYSFRQVADAMYELSNRRVRAKLKRENMATIVTKALDADGKKIPDVFARGIKTRSAADSGERYVDLVTGNSHTLSKTELDDLYTRGGYVAELHSPKITKDSTLARRIVVDPNKNTVRQLPVNAMPYIEGYYPRLYKEHYFVRHVPEFLIVNGVKTTVEKDPEAMFKLGKTVAAYGSKKEAEDAAAALEAAGKGNFRARLGIEHDIDAVQEMNMLYSDTTRSMRKRNEHLAGSGDNLLAKIEDPIEALETSLKTISNHTAKDDLVASMQKSWIESFGHLVKNAPAGQSKFPERVTQIAREKGYGRAVALKQLIDTVQRPPTITDVAYRNFVFEIAHLFEQVPFFRSMSPTLRRESRRQLANPLKLARKMSTQFFIALNPMRQILIQPGQLLQYSMLEPKYMASGNMIRDLTAISMAAASRGRDFEAKGLKAAAKVYSGDSKEFAQLVDRFFETSGVPWAVDANQLIENSVKHMSDQTTLLSPTQRAARVPAAAWGKVVETGKRMGFEPGEFINLAGSYLIAKRRWERANPGKIWHQRENANAIASDTTKISYAMTELGALEYQRGALGTMFQFMSVPHKALMSVSTNRYWSKADKAKIALSNIALFGAYGVGANKLLEDALAQADIQLEDDDLKLLKGGVMDWSINKFINEMFDEEGGLKSSIGFSEAASPFSGGPFPFATAAGNFFDGKWAEMVMGPAANIVGPEKGRFVQAAKFIQGLVTSPQADTHEKWLLSFEAVAGMASNVSNFTKARLWLDYKKGHDRYGQPTGIEHTPAEAFFKLFGYRPHAESAMYEITEAYNSDFTKVKEAFQDYINIQRNIALRAGKDPNLAQAEAAKAANLLRQFTDDELMLLGKDAAKMLTQPERDPDRNIVTIIGRLFGVGEEPFSLYRNKIRNSDLSAGQKQKFLEFIDNLTDIKTLQEMQ